MIPAQALRMTQEEFVKEGLAEARRQARGWNPPTIDEKGVLHALAAMWEQVQKDARRAGGH